MEDRPAAAKSVGPVQKQHVQADTVLLEAYEKKQSNLQVDGEGVVTRILRDDLDGSRHQRFVLRLGSGQTLLVTHNIDLAPRIDNLHVGDSVEFFGEYEWNSNGGVIHWTHDDPQGRYVAGWIKHRAEPTSEYRRWLALTAPLAAESVTIRQSPCRHESISGRPAMSSYQTKLMLCMILLLPVAPLQAARILVIGDSWGVAAGPSLQYVLVENGSADLVASIAVGGETAENINTPEWLEQITAALEANPDADFVHLSLGGNDFLGSWNASMSQSEENQLIAGILDDISAIVDHILAQRPDIRIYWSSYDFPRPLPMGDPIEVNNASLRMSAQAEALADEKGPSLSYGDFNGLTQVAYGFDGIQYSPFDPDFAIPAGDPSLPDPQYPGPAVAYADAIHLTPEAYLLLAESQYEQFYEALLNFRINAGLNDAWYNRATNGQGLLIIVFPDRQEMFLAWFTYDTERPADDVTAIIGEPGHRWLTAQGPYEGDTANLTLSLTSGGVFDAAEPEVSRDPDYGSMQIEFADCNAALVTYEIPSLGIAGDFLIERLALDNVPLCESLAGQAAPAQ